MSDFTKKTARAYVVDCCPFRGTIQKRSVLLASVGSCEIRMFRGPEVHPHGVPLFWLELFDHSTKMSSTASICHRIKDAVPIFDDFISQAAGLNKAGGPDDR